MFLCVAIVLLMRLCVCLRGCLFVEVGLMCMCVCVIVNSVCLYSALMCRCCVCVCLCDDVCDRLS